MIKKEIKMEKRNVIIFHKDCMDGLSSAYLMNLYLKIKSYDYPGKMESISIPMQYGESFENFIKENEINKTDDIYFVDFSLKRNEMKNLINMVNFVTIIDHHETAQNELQGLQDQFDNIDLIFDMSKSGAMLTYDYVTQRRVVVNSKLFEYIQDRDIWQWELENSKEVSEFLMFKIIPNSINSFSKIINNYMVKDMIEIGKILLEKKEMDVDGKTEIDKLKKVIIKGETFLICNATSNISEIGNTICTKHNKKACMYFILPNNKVVLSFRSLDELGPINDTAVKLGGGGHPLAAGATVSLETLVKILNQ